jgi:hypothetical protein
MSEPLKGLDAWKTDAPDPGHVGLPEQPEARTRHLWFASLRWAARHGKGREYVDSQRLYPKFAAFVAEVDRTYCDRCFNPLVQVYGHYAPCEECFGGASLDGDAPRGQETRSASIDQQIEWQRLK